jgi:peptidoglycan/LPS O-acetylase OafA/YrhL
MVHTLNSIPASQRTTSILFIPALDGVRGIAVSLVLLFHLQSPLFGIGWCGVDLFFVLSGYLITTILLATKDSPYFFKNFYARRVLRIFPLYFSALFVVFFVALPVAERLQLAHKVPLSEQLWYWLYLSNWRNASGHILYYLSHFWTLAVEEQFYLVWPFLVFFLSRRSLVKVCAGAILICLAARSAFCWNAAWTEFLHRGTIFRMDDLAWGALLALATSDPQLSLRLRSWGKIGASLAIFVLAGILIFVGPSALSRAMISVGYTALGLTSACLVWIALRRSSHLGWSGRILNCGPLRSFGKYSYGIYVLHYPIVILLQMGNERIGAKFPWVQSSGGFLVLRIVLGFGLSYIAALISWNLLEKRILRLKERFAYVYTLERDPQSVPQPDLIPDENSTARLNSAVS